MVDLGKGTPLEFPHLLTLAQTHGRVSVRAVISTNQYYSLPRQAWRLIPAIVHMGSSRWFTPDRPGTFLVVDNAGVDAQTAVQTFGTPDHVYHVGDFQVFTYKKGISCTVPPPTPEVRAEEHAGMPPHGTSCRRLE